MAELEGRGDICREVVLRLEALAFWSVITPNLKGWGFNEGFKVPGSIERIEHKGVSEYCCFFG